MADRRRLSPVPAPHLGQGRCRLHRRDHGAAEGQGLPRRFFGDVETYRKELLFTLTGTPAAGVSATTLTVKYQGCADAGVRYPPQTRTLKVALPGEKAGVGGSAVRRAVMIMSSRTAPPIIPTPR